MRLTDVTLREGGQMPGRSYTADQKVAAGCELDRLGVSVIQVGFPITGEEDREATRRLAAETDAAIEGIARAVPGDIDAVAEADADRIDVFAPLSAGQLEHVMDKEYGEMLEIIDDAIDHVREYGLPMTLTLMDAFRTDPARLIEAFERFSYPAHLGLADTVGARTPGYVESLLEDLSSGGVDLSRAGVHFHEDLGVGTANTLTAAEMGVGKADLSVANLGERAGNAALEEVVVADALAGESALDVEADELIPVCLEVLEILAEDVDPRKAVLGGEVTSHEAGIHTAAMLEEPSVFEPFDPAEFGGRRDLVFGEGTGRGGARKLIERAGGEPTDEQVSRLLDRLAEAGPLDGTEATELAAEVLDG
ncbi:citramalate synthase [Natronomonas sp. F2-12]|jgi:isopropylmalate/homocitrate/citramalate synthase|uniref:2-isopropylmalate synthase n=1 Tax=Natronomonas aquatica TaxID=2841590 RepID=A0A9R1CQP8_9EURY|nr:citramalate synthase [Natronomonas aquatica]MCQ4332195.1 citramalate synthase [Natronomonas aquatica]